MTICFTSLVLVGCNSGITTATEPESTSGIIQVTAKQLYADYDANVIAAHNKYKGQVLQVSGTVYEISKDILGDPLIVLDTGHSMDAIYCHFDKKEESQLVQLAKGQEITVQCMSTGFSLLSPSLTDCILVR